MEAVFQTIPVDQVVPSPYQARKEFDPEALQGLAESMRHEGLIEPIVVRRRGEGETERAGEETGVSPHHPLAQSPRLQYELISGERRLRAAKLLGWETIEAKIIATVSEAEAAVKGLIENIQREDLNPIEEAEGFKALSDLDGNYWTQKQIATVSGRTQGYVSQSMQLLTLHPDIQKNIRRLIFSRSHGLELSRLPIPEQQLAVARKISDRLTVHETRELIDSILSIKDGTKREYREPKVTPPAAVELKDPLKKFWTKLWLKGILWAPDQVSYGPDGWSFLIKVESGDPKAELSRWFRGVADALEGKFPVVETPNFKIPNKQEQAQLEELAKQGPYPVYRWFFGEKDEDTQRVKGKSWKEIGEDDPSKGVSNLVELLSAVNAAAPKN
jgi:ParB family transcriptional regulator, chromosome partitioning protein